MTDIREKSRLFRDISSGIAVSMLIVFVTVYLPVLGFFMSLILPMPVLYFRLKLGRVPGAIVMFAVFAMIFAVTDGFSGTGGVLPVNPGRTPEFEQRFSLSIDMLFYGGLLLAGFSLGEFLELRLPIEKSFTFTAISTIGICSAGFFIYTVSTGQDILSLVSGYISENLKLTLALYENMGMSHENIELISGSIEVIQYVLVRIIPALIVVLIFLVIWINILFINRILKKKKIYLAELQNLDQWKAPEYLVWVVIFFGLLIAIPGKGTKVAALNGIMILMPIYFFQGIAIISFIFEKKNAPTLLKVSIYTIIAIQQIFILAIVGIGFFDTWMNFRKTGLINGSKE